MQVRGLIKRIALFLTGFLFAAQTFTAARIPARAAEAAPAGAAVAGTAGERDDASYYFYDRRFAQEPRPQTEITLSAAQHQRAQNPPAALTAAEGETGILLGEGNLWCEWEADVPQAGRYGLTAEYFPLAGTGRDILLSVMIDGAHPFSEAETGFSLSRVWIDEESGADLPFRRDAAGNDLRPAQKERPRFTEKAFSDLQGLYAEPYSFYLTAGRHVIRLEIKREALCLRALRIENKPEPVSYAQYRARYADSPAAGEPLVQQAEQAFEKSASYLYPVYDRTDAATQPNDPNKIRLNTIGQSNWSAPGSWISWRAAVKQPGLYRLALRCRQNYSQGLHTYRTLKINGEIPFREAENIVFEYRDDWYVKSLGGEEPYLLYLKEGDVITLEATSGEMAGPLREIRQTLLNLNAIYRKIIVITGTQPDIYRDYALEKQIPGLSRDLKAAGGALKSTADAIRRILEKRGSLASKLDETYKIVTELADKPYRIPERLSHFKSSIEDMGALMTSLGQQPLELDYLAFLPPEEPLPRAQAKWGRGILFWFEQLIGSFTQDYQEIGAQSGKETGGGAALSVWVSTGRDQAQVIYQMIESTFTPQSGIRVRLSLVDTGATLIQAALAGKGPDAALMIQQEVPVNLAMRGALCDFTRGEYGIDELYDDFHPSAWIPYRYQGGVYALPESQSFDVVFYRTDVFRELGLKAPNTWDEFYVMLKTLQAKNLQAGIPEIDNANMGVSLGISVFDKFLFQNGGAYFNEGLSKTLFDREEPQDAFERWAELYTEYGLDRSFDFFNRFRSGEMPFAIQNISVYNQLMQAAPEIRGLWTFAPVPGTARDGKPDRAQSAKGHGCMMLKGAESRGAAQETVRFLKWWARPETQLQFAGEMEAALGIGARYYPAAAGALDKIGWSREELAVLQEQRTWLTNVPQIPGNYVISRSLTGAFRAAVNRTNSPRRSLAIYNKEINAEIARKRKEFKLD